MYKCCFVCLISCGFDPGYQEFKSHDREGNVWEAKTLNEITRIRYKVIKEKNSGTTIDLNKKREEVTK